MENTYIYWFSNFLSLFWFFIDYIVQILLSIWAFASKWTISEHNYKFEIPYFPIPPVEYNLQINKLSCPPIFSVSQLPVQSNDTHRNLPFNRLKILLFLSSQLPPRSSLCNCCWFYSSVWNWSINKHIFGCNRAVSLFSSWHCYSYCKVTPRRRLYCKAYVALAPHWRQGLFSCTHPLSRFSAILLSVATSWQHQQAPGTGGIQNRDKYALTRQKPKLYLS